MAHALLYLSDMTLKRSVAWIFALGLLAPMSAQAKPKKQAQVSTEKKADEVIPPPGYRGTNEGATGRKNATEDIARGAEQPRGASGGLYPLW